MGFRLFVWLFFFELVFSLVFGRGAGVFIDFRLSGGNSVVVSV